MKRNSIVVIVAIAVASLLHPVAARATEGESTAHELADSIQELAIRAKLVDQLGVDALRIAVRVEGKSAILSGTVPKQVIKELAPDVALTVKGTTIVRNEIQVVEGPGAVEKAESKVIDAALEIKVKSALLTEIGRNALDIEIDVDDGVVVLEGTVANPGISQLATSAASKVKGVKKVVNMLGT